MTSLIGLLIAMACAGPTNPVEKSLHFYTGNQKNHYLQYKPGGSRALLILPGMGEPAKKYRPVVKDLQLENYDVYIWDHLSQGDSDYANKSLHKHKVFINNFEQYIEPLTHFVGKLRTQYKEVNLLAHSMGAHIGLRILTQNHTAFDKLFLSTPMIEINLGRAPKWLAQFMIPWIYSKDDWCPGKGPYQRAYLETSIVTQSQDQLELYNQLLDQEPQLQRGGCTMGWLMAAFKSIAELHSFKDWQNIQQPIVFANAADDSFVLSKHSDNLCKNIPNCKIENFSDSKHELMMEKDEVRSKVFAKIKNLIQP